MKEILILLIEEFRESLPGTRDSIERSVKFPDVPKLINVAVGIRRSGKTYLIYQKIRELLSQGVELDQILFINFEDDRLLPISQSDLAKLLDAFYTLYPENHDRECYFFLDEIQNVENWPQVVRRFYDSKSLKMFLTGSSAKLLSREISTSLRGRSISTEVFPYSFGEYCRAQEIPKPKAPFGKKIQDQFFQHFQEYFSVGGFPGIQDLYLNERRTILQSYIDTVTFRDIVERHGITNTALIKYLIKTLINNVASPFAVNKFFNALKSQGIKVGKETLYQYLEYIEDTFLIFSVPIFTESIRKIEMNPKKIYIVDNGLIRANRFGRLLQLGSLFENQVYLDLRKQGKKIWYYKTEDGFEVDFVTEDIHGELELVQVVWDISDAKTLEREKRALQCAEKELGIKGKILIPQAYLLEFFESK